MLPNFIALIYYLNIIQITYCLTYNNLHNHLATKTPYRFVANKNAFPIKYEGCEPVKILMIIRHGTRLPSKKFIKEINTRLIGLRNEFIKKSHRNEFENIANWNISILEEEEKILTHEGEDEMVDLAERMQIRFPNILSKIYSNTSYKLQYTATQRTHQSAHYFATGLFGRSTANAVWYPKPLHRDPILRFYKLCEKWKKDIKENPETVKERELFKNGSIVQNILKRINHKLGFHRNLSFDDLHAMYMICAFETSWSKKILSPWCSVFFKESVQVMEYVEDLKYYWIDGYGYSLTYKQACPLIRHLVNFFTSKDENPKAVLYFTHSGTILKLLAHLGFYKDEEPLKHDNYQKQAQRLWKVSKIDSFGSNIAAVLFRCGNTEKILFLHQERIINITGCNGSELCDFNTFLNLYSESIHQCNFDKMCRI